jgi:AcrR family transcriptional regulator
LSFDENSMKQNATPTRQRILDAAAKLFAERGFSSTSIRDIAAELDIANPSIYHHFRSKEEILEELLAIPRQQLATVIDEIQTGDPEQDAIMLIGMLLDAVEVHGGIALAAMREAGPFSSALEGTISRMQPSIHAAFRKLAAPDNPDLRSIMAVAAVQGAMQNLMHGLKTEKQFAKELSAAKPAIIALAMRILRGPL